MALRKYSNNAHRAPRQRVLYRLGAHHHSFAIGTEYHHPVVLRPCLFRLLSLGGVSSADTDNFNGSGDHKLRWPPSRDTVTRECWLSAVRSVRIIVRIRQVTLPPGPFSHSAIPGTGTSAKPAVSKIDHSRLGFPMVPSTREILSDEEIRARLVHRPGDFPPARFLVDPLIEHQPR